MNKLLLNLVMLPSFLWRNMGADIIQLRAILYAKLLLDDRKPITLGQQKQKKDRKYGTLMNAFISLVMGAVYLFPFGVIGDRIFSLTLYFSLLFTMITFMLIADFSSILFDSRDKYILFPRPVNDSTLVLARLLHVFIYLFRIVMPMALPAWIMLGFIDGWKSAVLFPLPLISLVFIALFVVNGIYLLVLRIAKPEKFKDIINYFQVVTSIIFFASVYLLPRMFNKGNPLELTIQQHPGLQYAPSYWLAVCWSWIGYPVSLAGTGSYSVLAIVCPLVCMYVLVKWLAPQFSARISGIDTVDSGVSMPEKSTRSQAPAKFYKRLANLFNSTDDAKAGFMIGWLQTSRSRSFRMRVYPTFAYVPVYFIYMLTSKEQSLGDAMHHMADKPRYLLLLYMSSFVLISALTYLTASDQYKASWVYYSSPVATPGRIMIGAFKALMVKYFLPYFIAISLFIVYTWGLGTIPDIILALVNVTVFVSCIARISYQHLPFSIMENIKQGGSRVLKSFLVMIIPSALGFGHYFSLNLLWLKMIFLVLSSMFLWLVWDSYANTSWATVIKGAEE